MTKPSPQSNLKTLQRYRAALKRIANQQQHSIPTTMSLEPCRDDGGEMTADDWKIAWKNAVEVNEELRALIFEMCEGASEAIGDSRG